MKQIVVVATAALCVSGCGSLLSKVYADPVYVENGQGYAVHCDGTDHDMGDCRNLAGKMCAGPYSIQAQVGPLGNAATAHDPRRVMIIKCGAAAPAAVK